MSNLCYMSVSVSVCVWMCVWCSHEWRSGFYLMSEKTPILRSQFKIRLDAIICTHTKWTCLEILVHIIIIVIVIICLFKLGGPVTSMCDCLDSIYWCLSVNWLSVKSTTLNGGDCGASHLQEEECHKVNAANRSRPGKRGNKRSLTSPADGSNRPNTVKKTHWELYVSCNSGQ